MHQSPFRLRQSFPPKSQDLLVAAMALLPICIAGFLFNEPRNLSHPATNLEVPILSRKPIQNPGENSLFFLNERMVGKNGEATPRTKRRKPSLNPRNPHMEDSGKKQRAESGSCLKKIVTQNAPVSFWLRLTTNRLWEFPEKEHTHTHTHTWFAFHKTMRGTPPVDCAVFFVWSLAPFSVEKKVNQKEATQGVTWIDDPFGCGSKIGTTQNGTLVNGNND